MKCHYEILGVDQNCTPDDLKKAYRKLALEWHPDKNLHRSSEATETFQLIQQAYEVLIDPQERAWYDRHKDDILRGDTDGAYKDACTNVYQYFNSSCFKGYNDGEKGFYTVYRHVFKTIAEEDRPFLETENKNDYPTFGYADSSYEEVVHAFYAFWQSYCTARSYSWMDQYNLSDGRKSGAGRQVIRMMEKENKKLRDQHKKLRNEEVRELVAFVRKRDKRVQAHKKLQEERKLERAKKAEEQRRQQILERNKAFENYQESEWTSMAQFEDRYNELENSIDKTFGATGDDCTDDENEDSPDALYCVACEKDFRSEKAMKNHENSKKHKENVALLKYLMEEEEATLQNGSKDGDESTVLEEVDNLSESDNNETSEALLEELIKSSSKSKKKKKKNKSNDETQPISPSQQDTLDDKDSAVVVEEEILCATLEENIILDESNKNVLSNPSKSKKKEKKKTVKDSCSNITSSENEVSTKQSTICEVCNKDFNTRNKLFSHLKESGHAVYKTDVKPGSKKKKNRNV